MRFRLVFALAGASYCWSAAFAQNSSDEFIKQRVPLVQSQQSDSVGVSEEKDTLSTPPSKMVSAKMSWNVPWEPDHRHWNSPSSAIIYNDDSVYIFAHTLANMRRTGGIFDTGDYQIFLVNITLFDGNLVNNACQGAVVASQDFVLRGLNYKDQVWDVSSAGSFPSGSISRSRCVTWTRWIR